jgi:hypothetical protein
VQRCNIAVLACLAGVLGWSPDGDALAAPACRGSKALDNYLVLAGGKISPKRTDCGAARSVVKRFAARCVGAYTSQGSCRIKTRRRYRCASTLVGGQDSGALSAVKCTSGKARIGFRVKLSTAAIEIPPSGVAYPGSPYSPTLQCIDTGEAGEAVPPPGAPNDGIVVRATVGIPTVIAEGVQQELVAHNVVKGLVDGLGARTRNFPTLFPVFLRQGTAGITDFACASRSLDAAVVSVGNSVEQAAQLAAHELFHGHSRGILIAPDYPWFDDAAAEWSVWKAGLRDGPTSLDAQLQFPDTAIDTLDPLAWRYAMWRFVQFLDDKRMVTAGNSWPLIRAVVSSPTLTLALNQQLVTRGTSLGAELNAFWAEHLKQKPRRAPRVVPTGTNSEQVRIEPGQVIREVVARNLHTKLVEFDVSDTVNRVEFEFEPVVNAHFSGLVAANETRKFEPADSVAFCIGDAKGDNLAWPGSFPVVFTNGALSGGDLQGRIRIFAQTNAEQCGELSNRACDLLRGAGARSLLGPDLPNIGGFSGHKGKTRGRRYTQCAYKGMGGLSLLQVQRWDSAKALRKWIQRKAKAPGWQSIKKGDTAVIFERGGHVFLQVAVGQDRLTVEVSTNAGATSIALRIAAAAIRKL